MVTDLSSIRGQDRAVGLLLRYLESGKVPPGLLFHGEEGTGKERAALAFAAALFCRARSAKGACGACPDCRLLSAGSHPNFRRVSPGNHSIQIDAIRLLQEELSLKSFSDRPRAALLVPADRMTVQAANALLKTLEEPPGGTHLLLVAHRLSRLPPTIVSRCQKVAFSPLSARDVEEILAALPEAGGRRSTEEVRWAAAASGGSPGRALAALAGGGEERAAWLRLLSSFDPAAVSAAAAAWKGPGETADRIAAPLSVVRDIAVLSSGGKGAIMNEDLRTALLAAAVRRPAGAWVGALRALLSMSRMPPQLQKPLMLEAFFYEFFAKD
jgi:DNA polymerase III subunit delta'